MGLFTPHKKRPNQFRYKPRYFDPDKEAREQRRRELCGTSSETDEMGYEPGMYIRTQRDARQDGSGRRKVSTTRSLTVMIVVVAVIVFGAMAVYQRLLKAQKQQASQQTQQLAQEEQAGLEREELYVSQDEEQFNSETPLLVIPNDGATTVSLDIPTVEE